MANSPSEPKNWNEQKIKLRAKFSILTEADLNCAEGKNEEMLRKIQSKLGRSQKELETIIAGL